MTPEPADLFNFNNQNYEFIVRMYNGVNDVKLSNTIWDNLILEEDIFDWKIKGSIIVKSPQESLERLTSESENASQKLNLKRENLVYKFRNDGRDTLFITIKPLVPTNTKGLESSTSFQLSDKKWRLEIEAVIYDVEDMPNENVTEKFKKLYFWEKTYQMMIEKDSEFSTANTGSNKAKGNIDQLDNSERSLSTGDSVAQLLKNDEDFKKHSLLTNTSEWDNGSEKNKIYYSSPVGSKFINNLDYLLNYTVSSELDNFQPCIFKFERAEKTMKPKQFSLKSIKKYFEKAGKEKNLPKEYQIEHFFLYEHATSNFSTHIQKAPINNKDMINEVKADDYSHIRNYQLVDLCGLDYSKNLTDYRVVSYNSTEGQFGEESNKHKAEEYKKFYKESIQPSILTNNSSDRLVLTPFITKGLNTKTIYSLRTDELSRLADGRNRLLKYYLFSNLAISFSVRGSTHRQTGRFFGLSKSTTNLAEFDHKLEGQYFITNVIHHFSNTNRSYTNQLIGVKTHTFKETTTFATDDVLIIK